MNYYSRVGIEFKTVGFKVKIGYMGKSNTELSFIITKTVCEITQVGLADIKSSSRLKNHRQARQMIHYLHRKFTKLSSKEIGRVTRNDHSTVLHSVKTIENDKKIDVVLNGMYNQAINLINERASN